MRCKLPLPALATACAAAVMASPIQTVTAGDVLAQVFPKEVYLDARALAELRATNPGHYARATRILAAANHLCRPHLPEATLAGLHVQDFSCSMVLLTSLPPQREIAFQLDHTRYIARVYITDDPPRVLPAR